jgi:hypothetical protein
VSLTTLAALVACTAAPARVALPQSPTEPLRQNDDAVSAAAGIGYTRPAHYRIPPNFTFAEGRRAEAPGIDLMPWLVSETMLWQQRLAGTAASPQSVLVAETWFSPPDVVRLDARRQPVLALASTTAPQAYVNLENVGWLFAEAFARFGPENVGLEITVAPQATLNAMLVGLRPEWYYLQASLEDVIQTHVETVDRARLRELAANTMKKDVPPGQEAEEVTAFLVQVMLRKAIVEELRATAPGSTLRTVWVTSSFFGLDAPTRALAKRVGLSDAQIAQIESAMYRRMSGPLVNASGMRGRRVPATVVLPVRKFFDPAYAPENKEDSRGWGLAPSGKGRPGDALPAKIFLAYGAGLGPDSAPLANRFPDRFTLDEFNLEQRDVNRPGDTATISGLRLVPLDTRAVPGTAGGK